MKSRWFFRIFLKEGLHEEVYLDVLRTAAVSLCWLPGFICVLVKQRSTTEIFVDDDQPYSSCWAFLRRIGRWRQVSWSSCGSWSPHFGESLSLATPLARMVHWVHIICIFGYWLLSRFLSSAGLPSYSCAVTGDKPAREVVWVGKRGKASCSVLVTNPLTWPASIPP